MSPFLAFTLAAAALSPAEWPYRQEIDVPAAGLIRVDLPADTLNAARPDVADLRISDGAGSEVAYVIDQLEPRTESSAHAQDFRPELGYKQTILHITTGVDTMLAGVTLNLPAGRPFTKAARVEGSSDQSDWRVLSEGVPIFRNDTAAARLRISFPESAWRFLRVIIDDTRSEPVPITGGELVLSGSSSPAEPIAATTKSREENAGVTRIELDLGGANLRVASFTLQTPERIFTRPLRVAAPILNGDRVEEKTIAAGRVYRTENNGAVSVRLDVPIEKQIGGRELIAFIENGTDAPLILGAIGAKRRSTRMFFVAPAPGRYTLWCGDERAAAPFYDVTALREQMRVGQPIDAKVSELAPNPGYQTAVPSLTGGAPIDVRNWRFQKSLGITKAGPQQVELDPDVLAQCCSDKRDLRIVRDQTQLPFLVQSTSSQHAIPLTEAKADRREHPSISRWSLKLPRTHLPIVRLTCASSSPAFERSLRAWEEVTDERGEKYPHELGFGVWRREGARPQGELTLLLNAVPQSDTLLLETDNHENPAIELHDFQGHYEVTRLLFNAPTPGTLFLYYGNTSAQSPRYDLGVIGTQLLRSEGARVSLGPEEKFKPSGVGEALSGSARYIFWAVLALVVLALLALIARLLPQPTST